MARLSQTTPSRLEENTVLLVQQIINTINKKKKKKTSKSMWLYAEIFDSEANGTEKRKYFCLCSVSSFNCKCGHEFAQRVTRE